MKLEKVFAVGCVVQKREREALHKLLCEKYIYYYVVYLQTVLMRAKLGVNIECKEATCSRKIAYLITQKQIHGDTKAHLAIETSLNNT